MIKLLDYRTKKSSLRRQGKQVLLNEVGSPEFSENLKAMKEILAKDGVGLAATQVGWPLHLFMLCINENNEKIEPQVFLNATVISYSKEQTKMEEGCLSFPGLFLPIKRPTNIIWKYTDLNGVTHTKESTGFYSKAVQHEIDHCLGKVFIDRASTVQKLKINKWLKAI